MSTIMKACSYGIVNHIQNNFIKNSTIMKTSIQLFTILAIALLTITSCTKEEVNVVDVENYTNQVMFEIERDCNAGHKGCFEFVWPLTINFADGLDVEFEDYSSLRAGIKRWKEANPDVDQRPQLSFPLEIMGPDGTIYTIDSKDELKKIVRRCARAYWNTGDHRKHFNNECFKVVLPVSLLFPNGQVITFETRVGLKSALRAWKAEHPNAETFPKLAFPINVLIKDSGNTVVIDSAVDIVRLKETCSAG